MRLRYFQRPIEWIAEPTPLEKEAVMQTDLWQLRPGQYEVHHLNNRKFYVCRELYHLEPDNDNIFVMEQKRGIDYLDYIHTKRHERLESRILARFLPEKASVVPEE